MAARSTAVDMFIDNASVLRVMIVT